MPKDSLEIIKINLDFIGKCDCPETRAKSIESIQDHLKVLSTQIKRITKENDELKHRIKAVINAVSPQMTMRLESDDND